MIRLNELTKVYPGNIQAVKEVSFTVESGEIFGLLGPNGAGKTTIVSILCTIISPTSGSASVNGFDVVKQPEDVRKSIGIVFQEPSIDDRLTGRENLELHGWLYDMPSAEREKRIKEVLKLVELEDRANDIMKTYSSGMRRRLEIARGLLHHPKVLFLDEPTLGLDIQTREHIWRYIEEVIRSEGITVILTTHYMEEADRLCDKVAIIDYGKIKAIDTPENLKNSLGKGAIYIQTDKPEELGIKLKKLKIADNIAVNSSKNLLEINNIEERNFVPRLVEIAKELNATVESVSASKPTLNDVFLYYTGHEIRPEEAKLMSRWGMVERRKIK